MIKHQTKIAALLAVLSLAATGCQYIDYSITAFYPGHSQETLSFH